MEDHRQEKYPALWPEVKELFEASPKADIKKTQLPQITNHPDKPCFLLDNVLTKEECEALIRASEAKGNSQALNQSHTCQFVGFENAENYCWQYRDRYNDRFMSEDEGFSKCIFDRIAEHLPNKLIGWRLKGLNPRWRYVFFLINSLAYKNYIDTAVTQKDTTLAPTQMAPFIRPCKNVVCSHLCANYSLLPLHV